MVARYGDVDDAAGCDVVRQKYRGEFDLSQEEAVSDAAQLQSGLVVPSSYVSEALTASLSPNLLCDHLTSRLSSVNSTATPASTLPTVNETNIVGTLDRG